MRPLMFKSLVDLNLRLFDGAPAPAAPAPAAPAPAPAPASSKRRGQEVTYGKLPGEPADKGTKSDTIIEQQGNNDATRRAEWDRLIKSEYKDLYGEYTQKMIDTRFARTKTLEEQATKLEPILEALGVKLGVDHKDLEKLSAAIDEDESFWEEAAEKEGMTVAAFKKYQKALQEKAVADAATAAIKQKEATDAAKSRILQQAAETKAQFPNFNLQAEMNHPETGAKFKWLLNVLSTTDAYKAIHSEEIARGEIQRASQAAAKSVQDNIKARGMRPAENGLAGGASAPLHKPDPSTWTKQDRDEIERQALAGKTIRF